MLCVAAPLQNGAPTAHIPPRRSICLHFYCYPMQLEDPNSQNGFLNTARKERKRVEVYLVNGIKLTGLLLAPCGQIPSSSPFIVFAFHYSNSSRSNANSKLSMSVAGTKAFKAEYW